MLTLEEVSYSEAACVAAISKYYKFLTALYIDDNDVEWPPEGGWPMITETALGSLGKSNRVMSLLRQIPYFRELGGPEWEDHQPMPWANFCNWRRYVRSNTGEEDPAQSYGLRLITESFLSHRVNPHIIGLCAGGRDSPFLLLDTEYGLIYWPDCDDEIRDDTTQEQVDDDPHSWAPETEANWRGDAPCWAIETFFEMLEEQFRNLRFIPINERQVINNYSECSEDGEMEAMLQRIYRDHGWPDLERYDKGKCLKAVQRAMQEQYHDFP
ncbi:hypothetical protein FB567DRAFT_593623 [Paraphoma chrysanthemicola]|uniref:Uncharacterized protein n=1 Tax=Paraphoma chrysanthemicola TaxID=798071 RepID=A0A8K0R352_9PLEO|nr:hypothetical protein FB567DRAFT_593623 [Paraphoma chrysanthemicola]